MFPLYYYRQKLSQNTSAVTIADTIDKPFKPATLFLIIDKYVDNINSDGIASKEFTTPVWADFEHIDLKIMFETYSNERKGYKNFETVSRKH